MTTENTVRDAPSVADSGVDRMLLIETHSPWESGDVADFLELARTFLESGVCVHLHFIQNGVLWLQGELIKLLTDLRERFGARLDLSIDDLSLDLRGVSRAHAESYGRVSSIDALVAEMARTHVKTIWHS